MHSDRFIASCRTWNEFWERTKELPSKTDKGRLFERLTQLYLQTTPEYRTELQHVWLLREIPSRIRKRLNLPNPDEGIDLIAQTRRHEYWAIQAKFRTPQDKGLTRRALSTFTSLAFNTCLDIALAVVSHTSNKPVSKRHLMRNTVEVGLDRWQSLDHDENGETGWSLIRSKAQHRSIRPKPRTPKRHQIEAIANAKSHFVASGQTRGRMIMPCGTGKSLTAYWIAEALKAKTILIAVPSLTLIRQSLSDWTREFLARGKKPLWFCVCSDDSVGNLERDEFVSEVYDLGIPTHTSSQEIASFLRTRSKQPKIIFTTYQSSQQLAAAARKAHVAFDLAILDEAHKTVGKASKPFATLLSQKKIDIRQRIFMTATENVFSGNDSDVLSMEDNSKHYGARFCELSFKEAIERKLISDYKIITTTVSSTRIRQLIDENRILNLGSRNLDEAEAQSVAGGIALRDTFKKYEIRHAISFHRSIQSADRFREQQDALNRLPNMGPRPVNFHISSKKKVSRRGELLRDFINAKHGLMTNARCLTEGIDLPAIDCVVFADPKQSQIDIVQATGRALRRFKGKRFGYILIPIIVPDSMTFEDFAETTAFRQVVRTITALSIQDERIAEEFRAIDRGKTLKGKLVLIEGDVPSGMKMRLADFSGAISTRIWGSVGRVSWRPFGEARDYARSLRIKSNIEWREHCSSGKKPADIPASPHLIYEGKGWVSYGDWIGTGYVAHHLRRFRSFKEARAYVRALHLNSETEWRKFRSSGKLPQDIPTNPNRVYAKEGWAGFGDWLGTGRLAGQDREYRPFHAARSFSQSLGLRSWDEWKDYCKSGKKPDEIPTDPGRVYANNGWISYGDWLGTGRIAHRFRQFRPFTEARAFAQSLGFKSGSEWNKYRKSGKMPQDIPTNPHREYANQGWSGMGDWLGTGTVANRLREFRTFTDARAFVRRLGMKSKTEWEEYCTSGKKPKNIPSIPSRTYKDEGWLGYGDWVGTKSVATRHRTYRSFQDARAFVRSLCLKSRTEWRNYCRSSKKPHDIPADAQRTYANKGWMGMGDWLGTRTVSLRLREFRPSMARMEKAVEKDAEQ
jgi:superfamily II DNA or RNA helicase